MKVAIVHDWLVTNAGAEKVLKAIIDIFPNADIFSLVDFLNDKDRKDILDGRSVKTSFIQKLPFAKKHFRNYLPLFPKAIESLDVSRYDLLISSSWAVAKGVKKNSKQLHICYCHTPIRYAWDLEKEYTANLKQPKKFFVQKTLKYIRKWDIKTLNRVDYFIANSNFVKERIERIYKREATVIYPPVDTDKFKFYEKKEDYYLTVCRLVGYKKVDLIVKAFNQMPNKKLVLIGDGEELEKIKKMAQKNIEILGYQEDKEIVKYMQKAKAFVYVAIEDFGITPIEAMSCGTPVIALNKGGTLETVKNGITGLHFKEQNIQSIINSIEKFEKMNFNYRDISLYAQEFNELRFKEEFASFV